MNAKSIWRRSVGPLALLGLGACLGPGRALIDVGDLQAAWQRDQHVIWEVDWPEAPLAGPLVVEAWQSGPRRRYEILEATTPSLIGDALVTDGETAWFFNRFEAGLSAVPAAEARFSPLADALALVSRQLAESAGSSEDRGREVLPTGAARHWRLIYDEQTLLDLWLDEQSRLIARVRFRSETADFRLLARHIEPLTEIPPGLFQAAE
jgi:hypothetical protein